MDIDRRLLPISLAGLVVLACSTSGTLGSLGMEVGSWPRPGSPPPPPPMASSTSAPGATVLPHGSYRFAAGGAGVVTIRLADSGVALETATPNAGWEYLPNETDDGLALDVRFAGPDAARLKFAAERDDDGTLDVLFVSSDGMSDGQDTLTSGDAGAVTYTIEGEGLRVDDARANNQAGWHVVEDQIADTGFVISLANAGRSTGIRISAKIDDDQRLGLETWTRVGPGYRSHLGNEDPEPRPAPSPRLPAGPTPTDDDDDDGHGGDDRNDGRGNDDRHDDRADDTADDRDDDRDDDTGSPSVDAG